MRRRWILAVLIVVATASIVSHALARPSSFPKGHGRTGYAPLAGAGISIRVPAGWHLIRGWLSDVVDPVPRLAVASFGARLSRHPRECGMPNVTDFPRSGAFLFMWEYPGLPRRTLARFPRRPARFRITSDNLQRYQCSGPSYETTFQDAGRAFQAEIYFGPAAGRAIRAQLLAVLDSLRVAAVPVSAFAPARSGLGSPSRRPQV